MTDIESRTIVAPADRDVVALVRVPIAAGGEFPIPVNAAFLGWADDADTEGASRAFEAMRQEVGSLRAEALTKEALAAYDAVLSAIDELEELT